MSKSLDAKNALVWLLSTVKLPGKSENAFVAVKGHAYGEFNSSPQLRVLPGDQTTEKSSFSQNERTITFILRTHVEESRAPGADETASQAVYDLMYDLTDLILDTLDSADTQNTLQPTLGTYILNATRGDWFAVDTQTGPVLQCDINVELEYSRNN